jgi:hypothetical protein
VRDREKEARRKLHSQFAVQSLKNSARKWDFSLVLNNASTSYQRFHRHLKISLHITGSMGALGHHWR